MPPGNLRQVAPHPYGLTLSPDGTVAVTANSGVRPFSISIIRNVMDARPSVQQVPPGTEIDEGILAAVFMALAISTDNQLLYVGGGQTGSIVECDLASGDRLRSFDGNVTLNGRPYEDSYMGDLVLSRDRHLLYVVDQTNFRLVTIDLGRGELIASVQVGRYPFGMALSPDGK